MKACTHTTHTLMLIEREREERRERGVRGEKERGERVKGLQCEVKCGVNIQKWDVQVLEISQSH